MRRLTYATGLLTALTLALAGCASPGEDEANRQGENSDAPIPMTVARAQVTFENAVLAQEQGFFEEEGLEVTLEVSQGAAATNSAVVSGEFDVALTDAVSATRAIAEDMPIVVVAGTKYADPNVNVVSAEGLLVPPGSPIASWADAVGAKIGVADLGGLQQLTVMKAMQDEGLDPASVDFVALPPPALAEAALKGEVDAIAIFSVFYFSAVEQGFTPLGSPVSKVLPNAPQIVWIASREYAEKNPEAIRRFRAALSRGSELGNENPDLVRDVYREHTELPESFIDNMALWPLYIDLPRDGWETLLDVMTRNKELSRVLSYEDIVWEEAR